LAYKDLETQTKLESLITKILSEKIKKTFGLLLEVLNVRREATMEEKTQVEINEKLQVLEREFSFEQKKEVDKSGLKTKLILLERSIKELLVNLK